MSTIQVDRIIPYQSSSVTIEGDVTVLGAVSTGSFNEYTASQEALNATFATTGSNIFTGDQNIQGTLTASLQDGYAWVGGAGDVSVLVSTASFGGGGGDTTELNAFTASQEALNATFATTGSNEFFGDQIIQGQFYINEGLLNMELGSSTAAQVRQNGQFYSEYYGNVLSWEPNVGGGRANLFMGEKVRTHFSMNAWSSSYDEVLNVKVQEAGVTFADWELPSYTDTIWLTIPQGQTPTFNRGVATSTVMNLAPQDPLPSGNLGDLAVSGSSLYFYDGSWREVSLV